MKYQGCLFCILFILCHSVSLAQLDKKLMIIGIDGCRPDALEAAETPYLDSLISQGIYSPDALNPDITISGPGWSAILNGVWTAKHGVTNNSFNGAHYDAYPNLFYRAEQYDPNLHTVSFCHWGPINDHILQADVDFWLTLSTDGQVANAVADYVTVNDPDMIFVHLDQVDITGHSQGFSAQVPDYIQAIENVDSLIGQMWLAIQARPNYADEDWLYILTTDHGGLGTSHGGNSFEEERVFFIVSNPPSPSTRIVRDSMAVNSNCLNDSLGLLFDGTDDRVSVPLIPEYLFGANQDFTVEFRVKTGQSADVAMVGNKDWNTGLNKGFVFSFKYPSGPEWKVNIGDGANRADINTGGLIADNSWHSLAVSFDRDGWMTMYEDGQKLDSADISFIGDIDNGQNFFFGTDVNSEYDYSGYLAEVRIWDSLLGPDIIQQWSCQRLDSSHAAYTHLIGYWPLNDSTSIPILPDLSPLTNHGTVLNAEFEEISAVDYIYDFQLTPRLVDVMPTGLEHMCIPVDSSWNLDGRSWANCSTETTSNASLLDVPFQIFPNPGLEGQLYVQFDLALHQPVKLEILDIEGRVVMEQVLKERLSKIDLSHLPESVYFVYIPAFGLQKKVLR